MSQAGAKANPFANFWETLKTAGLNIWQAIKAEGEVILGDAEVIAKNIGAEIAKDVPIVAQQLLPIAGNLVAAFATAAFDHWTGADKAAAVDTSLLATAKSQGLSLLKEDAAMIRQLAYRMLGVTAPSTGS